MNISFGLINNITGCTLLEPKKNFTLSLKNSCILHNLVVYCDYRVKFYILSGVFVMFSNRKAGLMDMILKSRTYYVLFLLSVVMIVAAFVVFLFSGAGSTIISDNMVPLADASSIVSADEQENMTPEGLPRVILLSCGLAAEVPGNL